MKILLTQSRDMLWLLLVIVLVSFPIITNAQIAYTVKSPIPYTTLEGLIVAILNILIVIATPIIVLFIIYAGFLYVTAKGNAEQVKQATQALTYAIIGGVLIIGAVALSQIIANLVGAFRAP